MCRALLAFCRQIVNWVKQFQNWWYILWDIGFLREDSMNEPISKSLDTLSQQNGAMCPGMLGGWKTENVQSSISSIPNTESWGSSAAQITRDGSSVIKFPRGRLLALLMRDPSDELGRTLPAKSCDTLNGWAGSTSRDWRLCLLAPRLKFLHILVGGWVGGAGVKAIGGITLFTVEAKIEQ